MDMDMDKEMCIEASMVVHEQIKLTDAKGVSSTPANANAVLSPKQKQMMFHTESEIILKRSQVYTMHVSMHISIHIHMSRCTHGYTLRARPS